MAHGRTAGFFQRCGDFFVFGGADGLQNIGHGRA
jgi:hypothetical protein